MASPSSGSSSLVASNDNDDNTNKTTNDKMFFTTSDLINTMNTSIHQTNPNLSSDTHSGGGFELQRKMPDGTYRRADESEVASANFQSKMKQTAEQIKSLNPLQKIEWSKYQRTKGNELFSKGEYMEAMDVYLTCLVAMDNSSSSQDASLESDTDEQQQQQQQQLLLKKQIDTEIKLPVLLNLALSALKLGMLSKAEQFCNYAIDEMDIGKQSVKAYFRRGRIRMLRGHFVTAELDLDRALELITNNIMMASSDDNGDDNNNIKDMENEKTVILREKQKLSKLVNQASANKKKKKKAMQQLFKSEPSSSSEVERPTADLYPEKKIPVLQQKQPTYFEYYMHIIGRGAQKLLDIIGHGEDEDEDANLTDQQHLQKKNI